MRCHLRRGERHHRPRFEPGSGRHAEAPHHHQHADAGQHARDDRIGNEADEIAEPERPHPYKEEAGDDGGEGKQHEDGGRQRIRVGIRGIAGGH